MKRKFYKVGSRVKSTSIPPLPVQSKTTDTFPGYKNGKQTVYRVSTDIVPKHLKKIIKKNIAFSTQKRHLKKKVRAQHSLPRNIKNTTKISKNYFHLSIISSILFSENFSGSILSINVFKFHALFFQTWHFRFNQIQKETMRVSLKIQCKSNRVLLCTRVCSWCNLR